MMTKIGNMQKIMISLDIFAEEKSFLNWPENLPLKYHVVISGHPVYIYMYQQNTERVYSKILYFKNTFDKISMNIHNV